MGTEQQFCLRWNNHQSTLISVFDSLLENSVLVDCTLAADGQQLKAHKVVLSACSPYLETILSQHHDKHPIIILKDVKFAELRAMLEYMYRGEVNISQEQLGNFLKAAETLQIKGLTDSGGRGVAGAGEYNKYKSQSQTHCIPVDHRSRSAGLLPDDRKSGLVIPSHVVTDRAPQSPLVAREGSVSPTLRKRRKINNSYEPTLRPTFPSSDTPDTTSAFPESLPPHAASQGSPSPPLSESASSSVMTAAAAAAVTQQSDYGRPPSAVVKTELCNDTTSENEDSVTGDDRSINAGDDDRSNAASVPAAGPSRHFIPHVFGDKQHTLQDGSNDEFSPEDLQNSTQDVKLSHALMPPLRTPPRLYAVHATTNVIEKDKDKETAQSFPCDRCGKVYNRKGNLGRHVRYECGKGPQFPCHLCEKRFFRREKLAQHVRNHDMFQAAALPLVWGQGRVSI